MAPPSFDFEKAKGILDHLAMELRTSPPLIVVGEKPDEDVRAHIRAAGATWVLWSPFDDTELRFMLRSALALPDELSRRHDTRVPVDSMVWIRAGDQREVGVMSNMSARGAFIEMSVPLPVGTLVRLEFELSTDRFRLFARVIYTLNEDASLPDRSFSGIGVLFYDVDRVTERSLRTVIERLAARYLP